LSKAKVDVGMAGGELAQSSKPQSFANGRSIRVLLGSSGLSS
jgi:hypothetical protein